MMFLKELSNLALVQTPIIALEYYSADRLKVLSSFYDCASERCLPVYYWNTGYATLQQVQCSDKHLENLGLHSNLTCVSDASSQRYNNDCILCKTELSVESDVLQFLLEND